LVEHIREAGGAFDERPVSSTAACWDMWIDDTEKNVWYLTGARHRLAPAEAL
jgi:hypothetical protein